MEKKSGINALRNLLQKWQGGFCGKKIVEGQIA
jgi:hypothetical protein